MLVRGVQPPLIYVGGDGRLNNTQSIKSIYYFFCVHLLLSLTLVSFFLVLRSFFALEGSDPQGSRGESIDLGQPIAAAIPDGSLPGPRGFGSAKAPADCPAYRVVGRVSFDVSCGVSPPASRVHVTCSCVNRCHT